MQYLYTAKDNEFVSDNYCVFQWLCFGFCMHDPRIPTKVPPLDSAGNCCTQISWRTLYRNNRFATEAPNGNNRKF